MHMPDLLASNPLSLSDKLRRRTNELRSKIVKANYSTRFAQTTPELADFRHATVGLLDAMDDDNLSDTFRKTVHLTTYDSYAPLMARFSERPCKASAIVDLFAPGIPDCISDSSSTSSGIAKLFPKYNALSQIRSSDARSRATSDPLRGRTRAFVWYFGCNRTDVLDEDNRPVATIYATSGSAGYERICFDLNPEEDEEKMGAFSRALFTQPEWFADILPYSIRSRCTLCCWIYRKVAFFPPHTCTFCSRKQAHRGHQGGIHHYICGHDPSPRCGVRHDSGLYRERYYPRCGPDIRCSTLLGGRCSISKYLLKAESGLDEYFAGP